MATNNGGPAFPRISGVELTSSQYAGSPPDVYLNTDNGMSLRDWFAGQALAGVNLFDVPNPESAEFQVVRAYWIADAMLAEREK